MPSKQPKNWKREGKNKNEVIKEKEIKLGRGIRVMFTTRPPITFNISYILPILDW